MAIVAFIVITYFWFVLSFMQTVFLLVAALHCTIKVYSKTYWYLLEFVIFFAQTMLIVKYKSAYNPTFCSICHKCRDNQNLIEALNKLVKRGV